MENQSWALNPITNSYVPVHSNVLSLFPTIVNTEKKIVFCRRCHRWEYILKFENKKLLSQCGTIYNPPFVLENTVLNYSYSIEKIFSGYTILIKSQLASINKRLLTEKNFFLDVANKRLYKNDTLIVSADGVPNALCEEITTQIIEEIGNNHKSKYGIKPTISSDLKGFNLIMGYMLAPFNINFFKICKHWGLNPYNKDFTFLSSGDTPSAENEMFSSLGIKPTKAIRKLYQKFPQAVICYSAAADLGFTDSNILQKTPTREFYELLDSLLISFQGGTISYLLREPFKLFVQDAINLSNEKTAWNSVQRTINYFAKTKNIQIIRDGLMSYHQVRQHISDGEKREIMREGFNDYSHDFLVRRTNELSEREEIKQFQNENVIFEIEQKFLDLQYKHGDNFKKVFDPASKKDIYIPVKDEDRFCFWVAQDSATLKLIGSKMHNCVGWGYTNAVKDRLSTIVYATYKGKFRICIEVSPDFSIRQAFGPCNTNLQGVDLLIFEEWCNKKNIVFKKAFSVRVAPH